MQPTSAQEAAAFIYRSLNPEGYSNLGMPHQIPEKKEIAFRDPKQSQKVLIDYNVSNLNNLILGLSLNADVFQEAKVCRHFFAHRAQNTYDAVQFLASSLGMIGNHMPESLILQGRPGSGVRILDGWLADIENFFDLAS